MTDELEKGKPIVNTSCFYRIGFSLTTKKKIERITVAGWR